MGARSGDAAAMLSKGDLKFRLDGQKLKGEFALVHIKSRRPDSKGTEWLLIKHRDAYVQEGYDIDKYDYSVLTQALDETDCAAMQGSAEWTSSRKATDAGGSSKNDWLADSIAKADAKKAKSAAPKSAKKAAATGGAAATVAAKTAAKHSPSAASKKVPGAGGKKKVAEEEPSLDSDATRLGRKAPMPHSHPSHAGHPHRQAISTMTTGSTRSNGTAIVPWSFSTASPFAWSHAIRTI